MKIAFYSPPNFMYAANKNQKILVPSIGIAILTRLFNQAGHQAKAVDLETLKVPPERIPEPYPDVIGFTSMFISENGVKDCVVHLRKRGFKGMIVVGGAHASLVPDAFIKMGADLVVTGECEGNIVELVESGATGIHEGVPCPIEDIPIPDWENYTPGFDRYIGHGRWSVGLGVSSFSRGCPFECIFCANNMYRRQATRYRPPEKIYEELSYLKSRFGVKVVGIFDDEPVGTKIPDGWMGEIADLVEPLKLNLYMHGRHSKRYITKELMQETRRAGVSCLMWGTESLNDKTLKAIKKHTTWEDIKVSLKHARDAGIVNLVLMQIGQYQETSEDAALTCERLKECYREKLIGGLRVFVTQIYPGTELERISKEEGWYKPPPSGNRSKRLAFIGTPWMTKQEIEHWQAAYIKACPVGDYT